MEMNKADLIFFVIIDANKTVNSETCGNDFIHIHM